MIKISGEKSKKILEKLIFQEYKSCEVKKPWETEDKETIIAMALHYDCQELAKELQEDYDWEKRDKESEKKYDIL